MWWMQGVAHAETVEAAEERPTETVEAAKERPNIVRTGLGLPFGVGVAYERRIGSRFGIGLEGETLLLTGEYHIYGRVYVSPERTSPFASLRVGDSVFWAISGYVWRGPAVGIDAGLQVRGRKGFVFEPRIAADLVIDKGDSLAPRVGSVGVWVPSVSVWAGYAF